jgi:hypothetical protein
MIRVEGKRLAKKKEKGKEILFEVWGNFFKFKAGKFYSYGRNKKTNCSVGSWFDCGEEEIDRLRIAILAGRFKLYSKIPGTSKKYEYKGEESEKT